jgi:hypothetical protein
MDRIASLVLGLERGCQVSEGFLKRIELDAQEFYRPMNRGVAKENLILFKQAMDGQGLDFFIFFGTLLGAVREGDFIAHDYDTDTVVMAKDRARLLDVAPLLIDAGFEFARAKNEHGKIFTFLRKGEFIDVYLAEESRRFPCRPCWNVDGTLISRQLLTEFTDIEFLGVRFRAPRRFDAALVEMYGPDWRHEKKNYSSHVAFDFYHPYLSTVRTLQRIVPRKMRQAIKRLYKRTATG